MSSIHSCGGVWRRISRPASGAGQSLADYRRADELMRELPFIEPPSDMRERFFNSPEYLKLANARARQRNFITPLTAALVAAAMLVVALGGALLIRQGVSGQQRRASQAPQRTLATLAARRHWPLAPV